TLKLTWSTARTSPSSPKKDVWRSFFGDEGEEGRLEVFDLKNLFQLVACRAAHNSSLPYLIFGSSASRSASPRILNARTTQNMAIVAKASCHQTVGLRESSSFESSIMR